MAILRYRENQKISSIQADIDIVVTGVQADLTMLQEYYVDQQYKIINVRPIKSPLSKLLNNDAFTLWIPHRTVIFTDTKMIIKLIKFIDLRTLFSIFLFFCCILSHHWSDSFNYNFYNRFAYLCD